MPGQEMTLVLMTAPLIGAAGALFFADRERACRLVSFGAAALASVIGLVISLTVLSGGEVSIALPSPPAVGQYSLGHFAFEVDPLGAFFLLAISTLALAVSVYSVGYSRAYEGRNVARLGSLFNLFVLSMLLLPSAANAVLFLILWEAMSLTSFLLMAFDGRREGISSALTYVILTHAGTALIAAAFVLLWSYGGSFDFADLGAAAVAMPADARSAAFLLFLVGFGTKIGIVPLHLWLPRAYSEAPANVTALLSGATMKLAILMLVRGYFEFLGASEAWWGLVVILAGSVSAVLGALYALQEIDLRKVLAFSSVENAGILLIGLGASMVFLSYGRTAGGQLQDLAALALIATLFHVLSHSLFKGLLFLGSGAVVSAAGTANIEALGGLVKRMPWTSGLFLVGCLSISAIPPLNGFVSEWLLFQSLLLTPSIDDPMVNLLLPVAVGALALTGALAAAAFLRVFGITFLARPRGPSASAAKEVPRSMQAAMVALAVLCVLTGLLSVLIVPLIDGVSSTVVGVKISSQLVNGLVLSPSVGGFASMSPLLLGALLAAGAVAAYILLRPRGTIDRGATWDCGTPLGSRHEYTATAFAQPVHRVFRSIYRTGPEVSSPPSLIRDKVSYRRTDNPIFERYLYDPATRLTVALARRVGAIQRGNIQAYLAYIFIVLIVLLVVFR